MWIAGKEGDATVWHADVRTSCIDEGCRTQLAWFYSPDNIELLIKSLDGCHINGHIWSMVGSATTIRWSIDVYQYNQRLRDWVRPFVGDTLNAEGHMVGSLNLETIPCEGGVSSQWHQDQSDTSDYLDLRSDQCARKPQKDAAVSLRGSSWLIELDPVSWTPHPWRSRYPRCQDQDPGTRLSTGARW